MKIPHITRESSNSEAKVRYCERFPDWELDLENYPESILGPSPIGAWGAPESAYSKAVSDGKPLSVEDILRAKYYRKGRWTVRGEAYDSMEEMVEKTDWASVFVVR